MGVRKPRSAATAANGCLGSDPGFVEINLNETSQDQRRKPCYRDRLMEGGQAFGDCKGAVFVQRRQHADPVAQRTLPTGVPKQVHGIGQPVPCDDRRLEIKSIARLSGSILDPWLQTTAFRHCIDDRSSLLPDDKEIRDVAVALSMQDEREA
ncbi:hypothetical protein ASE05_00020 [Mesorhizobium sp. Root172]|nr:hypothetical protein ASE05_00020 [Mesorhizobium sp. Root172]